MDENEAQDLEVLLGDDAFAAKPNLEPDSLDAAPSIWPTALLVLPALYWSPQLQGWLHYQAVSFPMAAFIPAVANLISLVLFGLANRNGLSALVRRPGQLSAVQLVALALALGYGYAWWLQLSQPIGVVGSNDYHWQLALATLGAVVALRLDHVFSGGLYRSHRDPVTERNLVIGILATTLFIGVLWGWASHRPFDYAAERALSLLVGVSPIALLAVARWNTRSAIDAAEERGLVVNNPDGFIGLRKAALVLFDKTGIITTGERYFVASRTTRRGGMESDAEMLAVAAGLEAESDHAIAAAITAEAAAREIEPVEVKDLMNVPGIGVSGRLAEFRLAAGGPALLTRQRIEIDVQDLYAADAQNSAGHTVTYITRNEVLLGFIATGDETRHSSARAIAAINELGLKTGLLTGDAHGVAKYLAAQLGTHEVIAEVLPQDKAAAITAAQDRLGSIAVVAEAKHDPEALAAASISIALGDADADPELADIASESDDPTVASAAVQLSHLTGRHLRRAQIFAVAGNLVVALLAMGVLDAQHLLPNTAVSALLSIVVLTGTAAIATNIRGRK
jgi:cation transport ATPase